MPTVTLEGIQLVARLDTLWNQLVNEFEGLRKYRDVHHAMKTDMLEYLSYNCDLELQAGLRAEDSVVFDLSPVQN